MRNWLQPTKTHLCQMTHHCILESPISLLQVLKDNPRVGIYMAIHCLMAHRVLTSQQSGALREREEVAIRTTNELLAS
jgi:hypothetical protein